MNISTGADPQLNQIPPEAESGAKEFVKIEGRKKSFTRWLAIFFIVVELFLFLRVVLELTGANALSPFAGFVYVVSGFFLLPFWGMFPNYRVDVISGQSTFDGTALLALFVYLILIPTLTGIVWLLAGILKGHRQVADTVNKNTLVDPSEVEHLIK